MLKDINEINRQLWLKNTLTSLKSGSRILDAGAGELKNKKYCKHLEYVSQDFCQYRGEGNHPDEGLQTNGWDTTRIDLVSDITNIPANDQSFDVILCSEVLEHIPDPTLALDEFARLLKSGGKLILTAPFSSNVHMAPFHFCTGFSKYWYEHHLTKRGFNVVHLESNGDWFSLLRQEVTRLGGIEKNKGNWSWPLAYAASIVLLVYFKIRRNLLAKDLACFGFHCIAVKS